ncbi:flagellin lysine-N-methylase [Massilia sp. TN1-12]|uniref:flagellin lysine-N-methylase n=1 Tax=Massilia paldalensis TaxID=3377675 RepID=UPI00384CE799
MAILHRTRNLTALVPRYTERFRCIGPACEDTCCAGWYIRIDKKTYKAYRQSDDAGMGDLLAQSVQREMQSSDANSYAHLIMRGEAQECNLMQDGLCSVHRTLGESYLPDTCFSYPRKTRMFAGQVEQGLTLSCPEAARQALLAEDAFEFVEVPLAIRDGTLDQIKMRQGFPVEFMNDIRIFCLNVMQSRALPIWQRLAILGAFCENLSNAARQERQATAPDLIEKFTHAVEDGSLSVALEAVQPQHAIQATVFAALWAERGFTGLRVQEQQVVDSIAANLGANVNGQTSAQSLVSSYVRGLERLDQVLAGAPYLLENYLVNELFVRLFPFSTSDIYIDYVALVARFGLLRFMLAAQCNTSGALPSVDALVATVQVYCRRFQHDSAYNSRIMQSLYDSGWTDLEKMYSFLRS